LRWLSFLALMALVSGAVSLSVSGAGHNPAMKLRRLRDGDVLENGDVVLVRGGDLAPDILSADAVRYCSVYGTYGISVFAVRDATVDELAQQVPLVRFGSLALLKVGDVLAAGMRLEPTGRNPRHYTVGFDDLEDGVRRLASCPHQVVPNAYHDA
jgi:hypothetical protein